MNRQEANALALERINGANPVLVDMALAQDVVPRMKKNLVLTSGPKLEWSDLHGVQQRAIVNALIYEGLASSEEEASAKLASGEVEIGPCQDHGCVGVGSGIYTASMPVYVVENQTAGNRAFCHVLEGNPPRLFVNGAWGDDVKERLEFIATVYMPLMKAALAASGGLPLKPIMRRALTMGDELHTRNDAATQLLVGALLPTFLSLGESHAAGVREVVDFLLATPFSFMRIGVAGAKSSLDAAHGIEGSSVITGMIHSVKEFAIRVSGLGDGWFVGPHFDFMGKYFWGSGPEDVAWGGGESTVMESVGLGGFAQVAAFALPFRGAVDEMVARNLAMYDITVGENAELKIPYFDRGIPVGIDVLRVVETGIRPCINAAVIRKDGEGIAGVGPLLAHLEAFEKAASAYADRYPTAD